MTRMCDDLTVNAPRIVALWDRAVESEPWIAPRQVARPDFVPDLVEAIAGAAVCLPPSRASVLALARAAAAHASRRAIAGAEHSRIMVEYYFLRNAIWAYFGERHAEIDDDDLRAILFVDMAISIATRAALLGYYRREFEQQGTWPGVLERLVDELPPLWELSHNRPGTKDAAAASRRP
jgi:hypothetical protein